MRFFLTIPFLVSVLFGCVEELVHYESCYCEEDYTCPEDVEVIIGPNSLTYYEKWPGSSSGRTPYWGTDYYLLQESPTFQYVYNRLTDENLQQDIDWLALNGYYDGDIWGLTRNTATWYIVKYDISTDTRSNEHTISDTYTSGFTLGAFGMNPSSGTMYIGLWDRSANDMRIYSYDGSTETTLYENTSYGVWQISDGSQSQYVNIGYISLDVKPGYLTWLESDGSSYRWAYLDLSDNSLTTESVSGAGVRFYYAFGTDMWFYGYYDGSDYKLIDVNTSTEWTQELNYTPSFVMPAGKGFFVFYGAHPTSAEFLFPNGTSRAYTVPDPKVSQNSFDARTGIIMAKEGYYQASSFWEVN